jgi:hypothetical protein
VRLVGDLLEDQEEQRRYLELDHRAHAAQRCTGRHGGECLLGDRRVDDPLWPEALDQPKREESYPGGHILAEHALGLSLLADYLSMIKSILTVNTSAVSQAVIAGKLLLSGFSLAKANDRETATYLANMRQLLTGLARRFPPALIRRPRSAGTRRPADSSLWSHCRSRPITS